MTALGQTATWWQVCATSVLPLIADLRQPVRHVAVGPTAAASRCSNWRQKARLLDHLVSEGEQGRWYFDAEGLGGFKIDHELKLAGLDHRQVGGLFTLENSPNVDSQLTI